MQPLEPIPVAVMVHLIDGDLAEAVSLVEAELVSAPEEPVLHLLHAVCTGDPSHLDAARSVAARRSTRQRIAVAQAWLEGDRALADVLAREHLVEHPDDVFVAWLIQHSR